MFPVTQKAEGVSGAAPALPSSSSTLALTDAIRSLTSGICFSGSNPYRTNYVGEWKKDY